MSLTDAEKKALEAEKALEMEKTAEALKEKLGLGSILERLDAAEKKAADNVMKVFVAKDVQKDITALSAEEKVKAFAVALASGNSAVIKALSEGVNADGGFTVPTEFANVLIQGLIQASKFRGLVTVVPMSSRTLVVDSILNGPDVYWTGEGVTKTTTSAEFAQTTLTAFKLASVTYVTDELLEDSKYDLTTVLINRLAKKIAEKEDAAILTGNGTTQPQGLFTATVGQVTTVGNLDEDDIIDLTYALPESFRANARFVVNSNNVKELRKMKDSTGRYLWAAPTTPGQPATMQGYPVTEDPRVPESAIIFGDLKEAYWFGDRHKMTVLISNEETTAFTQDKTAIRVVERVAGAVVNAEALKKLVTIP